jgi:hypothetical protein
MKYAFLNSDNYVVCISNVGVDENYVNGQEYYGNIAQQIPDNIDDVDVLENWYWSDGWKVRPKKPSFFYNWDMSTESWVLDANLALAAGKSKQSQYLMMTAWTQLPDADLTAEKIQQWADYRAALKTMTDTDLIDDNFPPQPI